MMTSCVERELIDFDDSHPYLVSEVSPDGRVEVLLHTNQIKNQGIIYPTDAEIFLSGTGLDGKMKFVFVERQEKYVSRSAPFRVVEGGEYFISASIPSLGFEDINASTIIPEIVEIEDIEVKTDNIPSGDLVDYFFDIKVQLNSDQPNRYLHILPRYEQIDASSHSPSGIKEELQIISVKENGSALKDLFNESGMLVDRRDLADDSFKIRLSTTNLVRKTVDGPGMVHFEVRSVNHDYYEYHKATSNIHASASGSLSGIPTIHSNINNGTGVFSGYSTTNQFFQLPE